MASFHIVFYLAALLGVALSQVAVEGQSHAAAPTITTTSTIDSTFDAQGHQAALSLQPAVTASNCNDLRLVRRGCDWCYEKVKCRKCLQGWDLLLKNANCLKNRCCNQRPRIPRTYVQEVRLKVDKTVYIDFLKGVRDDTTSRGNLKVTLSAYDPKYGSGGFLEGSAIYSFQPNEDQAGDTLFSMTYRVTDQDGGVTQGSLIVQLTSNAEPVVNARATLNTLTAGVTAAYPTSDILSLLKARDPEGETLQVSSAALVHAGRGDKLARVASTGAWTYYCPSAAPCSQYLGNDIQVEITDGTNTVSATMVQPIKPRPGLTLMEPYQLQPGQGLSTVQEVGVGTLENLGYQLIHTELPESAVAGDLLDNDLLWLATDPATQLSDAVEFYPDINYDASAMIATLPISVGGVEPEAALLGIINSLSVYAPTAAAAAAAAANKTSSTALSRRIAAQQALKADLGASRSARAETRNRTTQQQPAPRPPEVQAASTTETCYGCIIDTSGSCLPRATDPNGCSPNCILGAKGLCVDQSLDPCSSCVVDNFGDCTDSYGDFCPECVPDPNGLYCISDLYSYYGYYDYGGDVMETHAWLVPPVKTTAMGFWVSLGCSTSGNITVEFDAVNDEDFDGVDTDADQSDVDRGTDPRRDVTSSETRNGLRRSLLNFKATSAQVGPRQQQSARSSSRRLQQSTNDRLYNGKGKSNCYTDDLLNSKSGMAYKTVIRRSSIGKATVKKVVAADVSPANPSFTSRSGGRKLLTRSERDSEPLQDYCQYYAQSTTVEVSPFECTLGSQQIVGVWFSAYISNASGYIRQVRVQSDVEAGGDPNLYISKIVVSNSKPFDVFDPLLKTG